MGENSQASSSNSPTMPGDDSKKVKYLVLDTGALIKGQGYRLASMAENFYTIPEVIAEVRDPRARYVWMMMEAGSNSQALEGGEGCKGETDDDA